MKSCLFILKLTAAPINLKIKHFNATVLFEVCLLLWQELLLFLYLKGNMFAHSVLHASSLQSATQALGWICETRAPLLHALEVAASSRRTRGVEINHIIDAIDAVADCNRLCDNDIASLACLRVSLLLTACICMFKHDNVKRCRKNDWMHRDICDMIIVIESNRKASDDSHL